MTFTLFLISFLFSVYSIVNASFPALATGILFALAGIAQEQFNQWK